MRHVSIALVGAVLIAAGCATAPAPVAAPATPPPARAAASPSASAKPTGELQKPVRQVLPNGLRLIMQDHRAADVVAVYIYVGVGVRYEKPDQLGFAHFQEHMLFKGTDKWGPGYIDRAVEGVGGRTNATTSFDYTDFYIVVPVEAMEMATQTLADMAFRSTFVPEEVDRERQVILEEANIQADNPETAIVRHSTAWCLPTIPTAIRCSARPRPSIRDERQLKAFNRYYYTPENMTLVVVGPSTRSRARAGRPHLRRRSRHGLQDGAGAGAAAAQQGLAPKRGRTRRAAGLSGHGLAGPARR